MKALFKFVLLFLFIFSTALFSATCDNIGDLSSSSSEYNENITNTTTTKYTEYYAISITENGTINSIIVSSNMNLRVDIANTSCDDDNLLDNSSTNSQTHTYSGPLLVSDGDTLYFEIKNTVRNASADISIVVDFEKAPTLSISDESVDEGDSGTTNLTFTITQSASSGVDVTVEFSTSDDSATAGSDYEAQSNQQVTIPAGSTSVTHDVVINGDTDYEDDESFSVTLSNPSNATLETASAVGTITNDDANPPVTCPGVNGLTGNYYNNKTFTPPAVLTRTDATVNFNWGNGSPDSSIGNDNFSVIWSGSIAVPEDASYIFSFFHDDDLTMTIDGATIYTHNTWSGNAYRYADAKTLTRGCHTIEVKFIEVGGGASAKMRWKNDATITADVIVPTDNLFSPVVSVTTTDLAITEITDSIDPATIDTDITYVVSLSNDGSDVTNVDLNLTATAGIFKTEPSGWTCDGVGSDDIKCVLDSLNDGETLDVDFIFTTPSTEQNVTISAIIGGNFEDSDLSNNSDDENTTIGEAPIVENADDLCYQEFTYEGRMCMDMGICQGGMNCTTTIPLNNVGGSDLSNVIVYYNEDGMGGSMNTNCDVSPDGTCESQSDVEMGPIGMLGSTTAFSFENNITSDQEDAAISTTPSMEMSCLNTENLYGTYTIDGVNHRGLMKECELTIGFDKDDYQVSEDYSIADGLTSSVAVKIELSSITDVDVSVTWTTRDGTALAGSDYIHATYTITIPAGEKEKMIYVGIYHDPAIEHDEYFYIDLTNIVPADGSVSMGINPTIVTILEQGAEDLPICYEDDFNTPLDDKWRVLRSSGAFSPQIVNDRLRLTPGLKSIATAVTKDYEFVSQYNMIVVEFEQYSYGGCGDAHDGLGTYGADGIVAVLYDSAVGASPVPGAKGGSMGYAQNSAMDGFQGGWLGLGIDEYGNYANCNEGRVGGLLDTSCDSNRGFNPQSYTNFASIRGDGDARTGYEFLAASQKLNPAVAVKNTDDPNPIHKYKMTTDARNPSHLFITLERDINDGNGYQVIINRFDAKDPQYNQDTTPDYVRFALTSGTGGGCNNHEIDELSVRGVCRPYNPTPPASVSSPADIVNNFRDSGTYNLGTKYITTKVSGKTEEITGLYLNSNSDSATFTSTNPDQAFRIVPYLSDAECTTRELLWNSDGNPAIITIFGGHASSDVDVVMPKKATKDSRFSMSALNFSEIPGANLQCVLNSSTTGNLAGIGQCGNSLNMYTQAFGQETADRCHSSNGGPCISNNGGQSCGHDIGPHGDASDLTAQERLDCGYNPLYDIEGNDGSNYGCMICTLDGSASCSSDNFAIRPDRFVLNTLNPDFPNSMRSGQDYSLQVLALDAPDNDPTQDYTITDAHNSITMGETLILNDGTPAAAGQMNGTASWSATGFDMLHGISTDGTNSEVANFTFNDVGNVDIGLMDTTWARVDLEDDRSTNDPSATLFNNCTGSYVCGSVSTLFIPHHFTFVGTNISNNDGPAANYTYVNTLVPANQATFAMSGRIVTTLESRNAIEGVTQNFRQGPLFYENPVSVNLAVTDTDRPRADETVIADLLLDFTLGQRVVTWNEADLTKVIRFNFNRNPNVTVNPFTVIPAEVDISMSSSYGAIDILDDNSGDGTVAGNVGSSATFLYGRTYAPRQVYTQSAGNAFIYYEVFCSGRDASGVNCDRTLLPNGLNSTTNDDSRWFVNPLHTNLSGSAGAVTQRNGQNRVRATAAPTGNHQDSVPIVYDDSRGFPYKTTMMETPNDWFIYSRYNAGAAFNEFEVEFLRGSGAWAGKHETTSTTNVGGSNRTNRRSMW